MISKEYVLDFAEDWAPTAVDERELEQFYASTSPQGGPPLADVREHVIAALVRTKSPSTIAASPPIELELLYRLDYVLPKHVAELAGERFWSATDAVTHLSELRALVGAVPAEDLRAKLDDQLLGACDAIASVGAPVRLLVRDVERTVSMDDQLAVLASVGVVPHAGITRAQLTSSYSAEQWAEEPYRNLADLIENSDGIVSIAAKVLEDYTEDANIYERIVERIATLAGLPLTDIRSEANFDRQNVQLSFVLDGVTHKPRVAWRDEWLDFDVIVELDKLARPRGRGLYILTGMESEESFTLIATDPAGYARLRAADAPFRAVSGEV